MRVEVTPPVEAKFTLHYAGSELELTLAQVKELVAMLNKAIASTMGPQTRSHKILEEGGR